MRRLRRLRHVGGGSTRVQGSFPWSEYVGKLLSPILIPRTERRKRRTCRNGN